MCSEYCSGLTGEIIIITIIINIASHACCVFRVVFWTDWGRHPRIEQASYDGSDRKALVSNFLRGINALAVDVKSKSLFCLSACCLPAFCLCVTACLPVCPCECLSSCLSMWLPLFLPVHVAASLPACPAWLPACCLPV